MLGAFPDLSQQIYSGKRMEQNVGSIERIIRISLGLGLLSFVYFFDGQLRWLGLVGVVPLVTGLTGWCPTYLALGIRLGKKRNRHRSR